jgi:hypothetical protein
MILIPISAQAELNPSLASGVSSCVPCKKAKSRCRFVSGALVCNRCQTKNLGTDCIIEPPKPRTRGTRSNSIDTLPFLKPGDQPTRGMVNNIPGSSTQRKRSNSDTSGLTNHPAKHPRLASQSSRSRQTASALNSIVEEDESLADTLVSDRHGDFDITGYDHTRLMGKAQFIDALAGSDYDEGSGGSDAGMEDLVEEIDIDVSSGSGSSEDEDEDLSLSQPVKRRLPSQTKSTKSQSTKSRRMKHEPNMEDTYDPSTCRKWPN